MDRIRNPALDCIIVGRYHTVPTCNKFQDADPVGMDPYQFEDSDPHLKEVGVGLSSDIKIFFVNPFNLV